MADWSGPSIYDRFYYRPRFGNTFALSVLENAELLYRASVFEI